MQTKIAMEEHKARIEAFITQGKIELRAKQFEAAAINASKAQDIANQQLL